MTYMFDSSAHHSVTMNELPEEEGHDAHLSTRERLRILSLRLVDGFSARAVADECKVSRKTVNYTVRKWSETGEVREHVAGGHDYSYDDNDFYRLECLIDQHDSATAEDLLDMMGTSAPQIHITTMRRYRHILGYTRRKPAVWVIDTERTLKQRIKWAVEHKELNPTNWVFMDESTLCLRHTGDFIWIKRGTPTPRHEIDNLKCAVNIWGIIWNNGSHFEFYEGSMTKEKYVAMLEKTLLPLQRKFRGRPILHDRHPAHTSRVVQQWVANQPLTLLYTPPHSPQFNAIEEVWAWVKHEVKKDHPQNEADLRAACERAWKAVPQQHIRNYISHANAMIQEVAESQD